MRILRIALPVLLLVAGVFLWLRPSPNPPVPEKIPNLPAVISNVATVAGNESKSETDTNSKKDGAALAEFLSWAEAYSRTPAAQRPALMNEGVQLVKNRRAILAALIQSDPEEALRQTMPMRLRREMPVEIVAHLEERISDRGELAVLALRRTSGGENVLAPIQRFARFSHGTYHAHVYGRRLTQTTRVNIPLHGIAIDGHFAIHESPARLLEPDEVPDPSATIANADEICGVSQLPSYRAAAAQVGKEIFYLCHAGHITAFDREHREREDAPQNHAVATPWTTGMKTFLFMRAVFPDDPSESISAAAATNMLNSASNWLVDMTYNATTIRFTITPLLMMPNSRSWYATNFFTFMDHARAAAQSMGYNTANYDRDALHFKPLYPDWEAIGYVGSKGMWLQSSNQIHTVVHELGHNYGLWHANSWNAHGDTIIGPGTHQEQGNVFDIMAAAIGPEFHFNAYAKNSLGWLPDANVLAITNSGEYRLHAYDVPNVSSTFFHALKIQKDFRDYWVEFRSRVATNQWLQNGVLLSWSPWWGSEGGSHLLDVTPGSPAGKLDSALLIGRTFSDPFAGIHLTPIRKNNTPPASMDVVVNLGAFPENRRPTLNITASSTTVSAGAAVAFTANGSDPDGDSLVYHWDFDEPNGPLGFTNGTSVAKSWSASGDYRVRCVVSDLKGGTASAAVLVRVGSPALYLISGRVLHGAIPLDGVRVFNGSKSAFTDANGDYIITGVANGTYTLTAIKPGWNLSPSGFGNPVTASANVSNVNFTATPLTYSLSGRVTDHLSGIAGVIVSAGTNSFTTGSDGNFSFNLPAGVYNLTAAKMNYELTNAPGWSNPVALDWTSAVNRNFQRPRYTISGVVSNVPSAPAVTIGDSNEQAMVSASGSHWNYQLQVPRGHWNVTATRTGHTILPANFANPITVTHSPGAGVSYNFNALPGSTYSISGNIAEGTRPIAGTLVSAGHRSGYSDTFGNFVLPGLTNGSYLLIAASSDYTFAPASRTSVVNNASLAGQDFAGRLLFWLTQPGLSVTGFKFQLTGGSNRVFRIEASTNLAVWEPLGTVTNTTGQLSITNSISASDVRFYRTVLLP